MKRKNACFALSLLFWAPLAYMPKSPGREPQTNSRYGRVGRRSEILRYSKLGAESASEQKSQMPGWMWLLGAGTTCTPNSLAQPKKKVSERPVLRQ